MSRTVKQSFVAVPGGELSFLLPNTWTAHCGVSLTVPGPWIVMSLEQCRLPGDVPAREVTCGPGCGQKVRAHVGRDVKSLHLFLNFAGSTRELQITN